MKLILLALITCISLFAQAQPLKKGTEKELKKLFKEQINDKKAPGLAVGIVRDGQIIFESYAGFADLKKDILISKEARFNYASCGKQFTALAILQLIADGKMNLNDDIRKFLPEFYPDVAERIEIQHLLTHTSGVRDVYDLWNLKGITWWEVTLGNQEAIDLLAKQQELSFKPGSMYAYSNSNYLILTEIIAQVTGQSFKSYSDELFQKLGMNNTAFEPDHANISQRVLPYGFWKRYRMYEWNADLIGDGALFTTLPDQLAWEAMIQQGNGVSLSGQMIRESQFPIPTASTQKYGYGLEFDSNRSFHDGSTGAYGATFARYANDLTIVVMTNYTNISASRIADRCYEIITERIEKKSVSRKPEMVGSFVSIDSLLGTYMTPGGYYFRFVQKSDTLFLERAGRPAVALEHEAGNIYHEINDPDFQQVFVLDSSERMQVSAYYPSHDPYTLTRQKVDWSGYNYEKANGTYYSKELDVTIELSYSEGDQYRVQRNDDEFTAQLFAPDVLLFNNYRIVPEGTNSTINHLLVNSSRNKNVRFTRIIK